MKKITLPAWAFPLALLALAALTYGPLVNQLGPYWDDWVFAWTRAQLGLPGLLNLFEITRPIRGWIEAALTPVLGISAVRWQVWAVLMRGLAGVWFWWFLRQLWPERRVEAFFAASLLIVYPGYTQQPQAMTFHYYWTFQGLLFLSFGLLVRAVRTTGKARWLQLAASVLLAALQMASMEYLLGQEIIRPVILWLALGPLALPLWERFKRTVLYYLPFALAMAGYLYWRFFMYAHSIYSPVLLHEAGTSPISTLTDLLGTTFGAIYTVLIPSWLQAFQLPTVEALGVSLTWVYGLVFFAVLLGWAWLLQAVDDHVERPFPWLWILCGLGGMLVAGAPFFIAGLPLRTTFPENRVSLPFIPFIGLFLAGLFSLIPGRARRYLLAGILLAFAAGFQIQNAAIYRDQYKLDKSFFWQLTWRAPGLKPGTALLAQDDQTFIFDDDEALTIPLNWIYAPELKTEKFSYQYQTISIRLAEKLDGMLAQPQSSQALVVRFAAPGCLHLLDPQFDGWLTSLPHAADVAKASALGLPLVPAQTLRALPLSNPGQILVNAPQPALPALLGAEPAHGWCYTYQKADLARQQGDWKTVARLGDEAFAIPSLPDDPFEYLPFIEAYARLGRVKDARLLTRQVAEQMPLLKPGLCAVWERSGQQGAVAPETVAALKSELQVCPVP
jgi:hypothetical protein